jgi:hypothetical protein
MAVIYPDRYRRRTGRWRIDSWGLTYRYRLEAGKYLSAFSEAHR